MNRPTISLKEAIALEQRTARDGEIRCIFYGRYSSSMQNSRSIDDQFANCRRLAARKGWVVIDNLCQFDEEKSGRTRYGRAGFESLIEIVKAEPKVVDYVIFDDSSRLGRNASETMHYAKIIKFYDVQLYFVESELDSNDQSYWDRFCSLSVQDEQYSVRLGLKVRRGQRGHFSDGYQPGGACYGYDNIPEYDNTRRGLYGNNAVKGVRQAINPEEAEIIRRIFAYYADGKSYRDITIILNKEGVPSPRKKVSAQALSWSKHAVETIAKNERYIGKLTWGVTTEYLHPETGKKVRKTNPQNEWLFRESPELRIISDELWQRVQERRIEKSKVRTVQQTGGMHRTPAARKYLLSGIMRCGNCGGRFGVTTSNPTRYGCMTHRYRGTCSNSHNVQQLDFDRAFVTALSENLRNTELRDDIANALHQQIISEQRRREESIASMGFKRAELEATRKKYEKEIANMLIAIKQGNTSRFLASELGDTEDKLKRIAATLDEPCPPPAPDVPIEEVRDFLDSELKCIEELLMGEAEKVKAEFQRSISQITITARQDTDYTTFIVSGDISLFSARKDVMQSHPIHLMGLHYTLPVQYEYQYMQRRSRKHVSTADNSSAAA